MTLKTFTPSLIIDFKVLGSDVAGPIVATIGPATSDPSTLKSMIKEGVNVFRVNFSHGAHEDHIKAIKKIRLVDNELGTHSAILADLQGPKIRIGDMHVANSNFRTLQIC